MNMNFIDDLSQEISIAQLKAFINVLLIPVALLVVTMNLMFSFAWIALSITIYTTFKRDTENAREFFNFLYASIALGLFLLSITIAV